MEGIEKIKAGLAICSEAYTHDSCQNCPYFESEECSGKLMQDAKEAIEALEADRKERDELAEEYQALEYDNERLRRSVQKLKARILKTNWHRPEDKKPPYHTELKVWTNKRREYIATFTLNEEWVTEGVFTFDKAWITEGFLRVRGVTHWAYLDKAPKGE